MVSPTRHKKAAAKAKKKADYLLRLEACRERPDNQRCADCGAENPAWASVLKAPVAATTTTYGGKKLGVFCCNRCCSYHMQMGRDVCEVKNIKKGDDWSDEEVKTMEASGNVTANAIYEGLILGEVDKKPNPNDIKAQAKFVEDKYMHLSFFCKNTYQTHCSWFTYNQQSTTTSLGKKLTSSNKNKTAKKHKHDNKQSKNNNKNKDKKRHSSLRGFMSHRSLKLPDNEEDDDDDGNSSNVVVNNNNKMDMSQTTSITSDTNSRDSEMEDSSNGSHDRSISLHSIMDQSSSSLNNNNDNSVRSRLSQKKTQRYRSSLVSMEQDAKKRRAASSLGGGLYASFPDPKSTEMNLEEDDKMEEDNDSSNSNNAEEASLDGSLAHSLARRALDGKARSRRGSVGHDSSGRLLDKSQASILDRSQASLGSSRSSLVGRRGSMGVVSSRRRENQMRQEGRRRDSLVSGHRVKPHRSLDSSMGNNNHMDGSMRRSQRVGRSGSLDSSNPNHHHHMDGSVRRRGGRRSSAVARRTRSNEMDDANDNNDGSSSSRLGGNNNPKQSSSSRVRRSKSTDMDGSLPSQNQQQSQRRRDRRHSSAAGGATSNGRRLSDSDKVYIPRNTPRHRLRQSTSGSTRRETAAAAEPMVDESNSSAFSMGEVSIDDEYTG